MSLWASDRPPRFGRRRPCYAATRGIRRPGRATLLAALRSCGSAACGQRAQDTTERRRGDQRDEP